MIQKHKQDALAKRWHKGKGERVLTIRGGLELALRRATSLVSAHSLGRALVMYVSRQSVVRYELRFRAAQVAAGRHGQRTQYFLLDLPLRRPGGVRYAHHNIQADRPDTDIWNR